jgi:hypothetical protein
MFFPVAHPGHWLPDLLIYGGPVIIGILAVRYADRKERKKDKAGADEQTGKSAG